MVYIHIHTHNDSKQLMAERKCSTSQMFVCVLIQIKYESTLLSTLCLKHVVLQGLIFKVLWS